MTRWSVQYWESPLSPLLRISDWSWRQGAHCQRLSGLEQLTVAHIHTADVQGDADRCGATTGDHPFTNPDHRGINDAPVSVYSTKDALVQHIGRTSAIPGVHETFYENRALGYVSEEYNMQNSLLIYEQH